MKRPLPQIIHFNVTSFFAEHPLASHYDRLDREEKEATRRNLLKEKRKRRKRRKKRRK